MSALQGRLRQPLPGWAAMNRMSPSGRQFVTVDDARRSGCREACTLVVLYPWLDTVYTVLTLRSSGLRDHAGQVSLPGGTVEAGEPTADCAFREAEEELGISPEVLRLLGELTPLYIPPSGFCVSPAVAAACQRPTFRPQASEVREVIEVPMDELANGISRRTETRCIRGEDRLVPYYTIGAHKIWGATAMVLSELATLWSESDLPTGGEHE